MATIEALRWRGDRADDVVVKPAGWIAIAFACFAPTAALADDAPPAPETPAPDGPDELTDEEMLRGSEVIVITETRSERPAHSGTAAGEVVTRTDLERTGGRTVADALQTRPGVWVE